VVDFCADPSFLAMMRAKAHRISDTSHLFVDNVTAAAAPFASCMPEYGSSVLKYDDEKAAWIVKTANTSSPLFNLVSSGINPVCKVIGASAVAKPSQLIRYVSVSPTDINNL